MPFSRRDFLFSTGALLLSACVLPSRAGSAGGAERPPPGGGHWEVEHTDEEWRKILTEKQYYILRQEGTERPFTGAWWNEHRAGTFSCAGCQRELFSSKDKFDSGTGWPSYTAPIDPKAVVVVGDNSLGMTRDEVRCGRCGGHLGHVFDDGPAPTGKRYCIDGDALLFSPA